MLSEQLREMGLDIEAKRAEQLEGAVADLADRLGMVRFALEAAASVLDGASKPDHFDDHPGGSVRQAAV
jgi:chemotaxis regulatin CheY-phosphate phosphatase CheZ